MYTYTYEVPLRNATISPSGVTFTTNGLVDTYLNVPVSPTPFTCNLTCSPLASVRSPLTIVNSP